VINDVLPMRAGLPVLAATTTGVQSAQPFFEFAEQLASGAIPRGVGRKASRLIGGLLRELETHAALAALAERLPAKSLWQTAARIEDALAHFESRQGLQRMKRGDLPANKLEEHLRVLIKNNAPRTQRRLFDLLQN
jgi:hypothetical protein